MNDKDIHNVNNTDPANPIFSIDDNFVYLMRKGEKKWAKNWVAKKKILRSHKFQINIKPFPYSNDDTCKLKEIYPGFERAVKKKMAPNKPIPKCKSNELSRKIARRNEIFA